MFTTFIPLQVTLKGAKNCVDGARNRILEIVNDLENQVTIECIIDQVHHRTIMGTRGSKVQKICSDFDVQIKIPDRAKENGTNGEEVVNGNGDCGSHDVIKITGRSENCESAKQALINLVPINIEVCLRKCPEIWDKEPGGKSSCRSDKSVTPSALSSIFRVYKNDKGGVFNSYLFTCTVQMRSKISWNSV